MAIRVATHGPTLAWAKTIGDVVDYPPPLEKFNGTEINWCDWEIAPELSHVGQLCERCGYDGQQWITFGMVPHETYARPVKRLFALKCPACDADVIIDKRDWSVIYGWGDDKSPQPHARL